MSGWVARPFVAPPGTIPTPLLSEALTSLRNALVLYLLLAAALVAVFLGLGAFELAGASSSTFADFSAYGVPYGFNPTFASAYFSALWLALVVLLPTTWALWHRAGGEMRNAGSFGPRAVQLDTQRARHLSTIVLAVVPALLVVAIALNAVLHLACSGACTSPATASSDQSLAIATVTFVGLPGAIAFVLSAVSSSVALRNFARRTERTRTAAGTASMIAGAGLWLLGSATIDLGPPGAAAMAAGAIGVGAALGLYLTVVGGMRRRLGAPSVPRA